MSEKRWHQNPWAWCGCGCCLGIVVIPFLLASLGVGGAFWAIRSAGVQDEALDLARNNPQIVERLGEPLELGWLMSGSIAYENDEGSADYSMPIAGPKGKGRLFVVADRVDSEWIFRELYVRSDGERIDLVEGSSLPMPEGADTATDWSSSAGSAEESSGEASAADSGECDG